MGPAARHGGSKLAGLRLLALALAALLAGPALAEKPGGALARAEAAWGRRGEGQSGDGRARRAPIARAIRAYEAAVAEDPDALEPRWKLVGRNWG